MDGVPPTVTRTCMLTPVVPGALIDIAPEKGPLPAGNEAGLTETCKVLGRFPEGGVTVSQFPVPLVNADAVNVVTLALLLVTETDCEAGSVLLAANAKLSEFGLTESGLTPPCEFAFSTTGMVTEAPGAVTLINPVSVPEVGALGPIETVNCTGVFPPDGVTTNQLFAEKAFTVTFTDVGVELTNTICDGVVTPVCVLNVSCDGLADSVVLCANAESKQHSTANSKAPTANSDFSTVFTSPPGVRRIDREEKTRN